MENKIEEGSKVVSILFAKFLEEDCIRGTNGWCLDECLDDYIDTEFELDELFDYWWQNILWKQQS